MHDSAPSREMTMSESHERPREAASRERDLALDFGKVLAATSIVLLHAGIVQASSAVTSPAISVVMALTSWGMPFFLVASGYLQGRGMRDGRPATGFAAKRISRLLVPFAFWTVAYLVSSSTLALFRGVPVPAWNPVAVVFLGGADAVLWFFPALLYISLSFSFVRTRGQTAALLIAGILADAALVIFRGHVPANIFVNRFPLALAAFALGFWMSDFPYPGRRSVSSSVRRGLVGIVILALLVSAVLSVLELRLSFDPAAFAVIDGVRFRLPWIAGALLLPAISGLPLPKTAARLALAARWGVGVYAIHMLVLHGLAAILRPEHYSPEAWVAIGFLGAILVAQSSSWALYRWHPTRRLVN